MTGKSRTTPEHTCSPAQSREGSAASQPLLLIPRSSNTARIPGILRPRHPEGLGRIRPSPQAERQGRCPDSQRGRSNTTHVQRERLGRVRRGGGGAPSNGNSNRSCTNGSLITINYHFRLPSSAAEPPLCLFFFVPPLLSNHAPSTGQREGNGELQTEQRIPLPSAGPYGNEGVLITAAFN